MGKVDVLAVMDEFGTDYKTYIPQFHAYNRKRMKATLADFDAARAAIAELIAADKEYDEAYAGCLGFGADWNTWNRLHEATARRASALATATGGAQ